MDLRKILLVLIIATLSVSDQIDDEGDTTSISRKERFLLATLKFRNERCQIGSERGTCKGWKECWLLGGKSVGSCPLGHGVCCSVQYTCGNITSERVSYFVQPNVLTPYCSLRVNVYDRRVTQLRLDFEKFSLSQPRVIGADPVNNKYPAYFCHDDTFTVASASAGSSGNLGFINLCGENTGQHIYVPVNATTGSASADLIFHLNERINSNGLVQPQWKIRITQIDCCAPDAKELCAPAGCLQYYPDRFGTFESFNYNNGAGPYQGLLNYAICFKRYDGICSIRYSSSNFQLPAVITSPPNTAAACNSPTTDPQFVNSQDFLFIPDGLINQQYSSFYCGVQTLSVSTNAPGPLYVFFRTDAVADTADNGFEIGFRVNYAESASGCYGLTSSEAIG